MWFVFARAGPSVDPFLPIVIALPFFVFGPLLAAMTRGAMNWIIRAVSCAAMLVAWTVPIACRHLVSSSPHWGCDDLMSGYYLYCIAHTVAAIYIVMPARDPQNMAAREASGFQSYHHTALAARYNSLKPDQKPTLDYGRPEPRGRWRRDFTICIACAAIGWGCLLASALWYWKMIYNKKDMHRFFMGQLELGIEIVPALGFVLLFVAWRIFRRLKCD